MAVNYVIKGEPRQLTGKQVKRLRAAGQVPAVLYGHNVKPQLLTLARGDLEKVYRQAGGSSVVEIKLPDGSHNALIHEIDHHPVTGQFRHADLYQVRMDEKVKTTVPLVVEGTAPAVRELDGILLTNLDEVEIEALPGDLPQEIAVDVSGMDSFESVITVADLRVPTGVAVLTEPETNVATVQPPKTDEQLEAELAEDTEVTTADDVEVEGEAAEGEEGEAAEGESEDKTKAESDGKETEAKADDGGKDKG